jgi:hypothetical protein
MIRRFVLGLVLAFCCSGAFAQAMGGLSGFSSTCDGNGLYYSTNIVVLEQACVALYNSLPLPTGYTSRVYTYLSCYPGQALCYYSYTYVEGTQHGTQSPVTDYMSVASMPANASCQAGVYNFLSESCSGGIQQCVSGTALPLTVLSCYASSISGATGSTPSCPAELPPPNLVGSGGCEFKFAFASTSPVCWISSVSGNMYCSDVYVTDGDVASPTDPSPITSSDSLESVACPSAGCGTGGSPGVLGAAGSAAASSSGAAVCGGPGLPVCLSSDATAENTLNSMQNFLTDPAAAPPPPDPIPNTVADLNAAGLNGGTTFSALTSWQLPAHDSVCPSGSFAALGTSFTLDSQCAFATQNLGLLRNVMIAAFTILALFIVLKA